MRRMTCVLLTMGLVAGALRAEAQSIDIVDGANGNDFIIQPFTPFTFFIIARPGGAATELSGVEFRVAGVPDGTPWILSITPPPFVDVCFGPDCGPFGAGARMGFPICQTGPLVLFTVTAIALQALPALTLIVTGHEMPSDPAFACPSFTLCDPNFTRRCVVGGCATINSDQGCSVALEPRSWSRLKALYASP